MFSLAQVEEARRVLQGCPLFVETPLIEHAERWLGGRARITLKLENMQGGGSFKLRGVAPLMAAREGSTKLCTMSAGNFGRTFSLLGDAVCVVMPESAPDERQRAMEENGARVLRAPTSRLMATVERLVGEEGYTFVHPFDNEGLFAGYATLGLETVRQLGGEVPDVFVVGVGGGGLISGVGGGLRDLETRVVGVEPEGAASMVASLKQGSAVTLERVDTMCHGLAPPFAGSHCLRYVQEYVEDVVTVTDEQVRHAMRVLFEKLHLVVETSGAASLAALLAGKLGNLDGKHVCIVLCGGNISADELRDVIQPTETECK